MGKYTQMMQFFLPDKSTEIKEIEKLISNIRKKECEMWRKIFRTLKYVIMFRILKKAMFPPCSHELF